MDYARLTSPATRVDTPVEAADVPQLATFDKRLVIAILVASVVYQALLCFINTEVFSISRALVGVAEAAILLACLPLLARRLLPGVLIIALLAGAMLCLLSLFSGAINIKAFRDVAIPLCYFWLGCNIGRPEIADRALVFIISIILAIGFFELFFLDQFTEFFNIFQYYVNIGNLETITSYVRESKLQLNGMRPEGIGRTLLPQLIGPHRVSSVFLEPVSLGNFATLTAAWGLSREKSDWRQGAFFVFAAVVLMVLSDSRFALVTVSMMVIMRFTLNTKLMNFAVLAPFVCLGVLVLAGLNSSGHIGDNYSGRLAISGWSLLGFDAATLLGAVPPMNFGDQGYAYVLSSFGLPLCLLLWFTIWMLPMPDDRGIRFRAYISIYTALILCVSGTSLFALKSASVLWFMLGCSLRNPMPENLSAQPLIKRVLKTPQVAHQKP